MKQTLKYPCQKSEYWFVSKGAWRKYSLRCESVNVICIYLTFDIFPPRYNGDAWIGLKEEMRVHGRWSGSNGSTRLQYIHWQHGQPDNDGPCVQSYGKKGWFDYSCNVNSWFLCYNGKDASSGPVDMKLSFYENEYLLMFMFLMCLSSTHKQRFQSLKTESFLIRRRRIYLS